MRFNSKRKKRKDRIQNKISWFLTSYNEAIDMANGHYDYLWLGSAKEGLACATLLMDYLHADVGVNDKDTYFIPLSHM